MTAMRTRDAGAGAPGRRAILGGAAALALAGCATVDDPPLSGPPRGRVLLLRGLANVFSTGMDQLGTKLQAAGYHATVHNHIEWNGLAEETLVSAHKGDLPRPFAVVGHSLGADDGIRLAARVGQAARVADLLVTLDPVLLGVVPPGPAFVRNYYQTTGVWGRGLDPGPGFSGVLENRAVPSDNHFTIDKDPAIHRAVLQLLAQIREQRAGLLPPALQHG
jgi:hypothetical protein